MSFREVRNFTNIMKNLSYPRLISVENFRSPNFELVADVLYWMIRRINPTATVHEGIESEGDRINFLNDVSHVIFEETNISVDSKKLYISDGYAVKELLKVAIFLQKADTVYRAFLENLGNGAKEKFAPRSEWIKKAKDAKHLASEITEDGARLYDLLMKEQETKKSRDQSLAFLNSFAENLDNGRHVEHIENCLSRNIGKAKYDIDQFKKKNSDLQTHGRGLEDKLKNKKIDLDRNKNRLKNLEDMRPSFMGEFEKVEVELKSQYEGYVDRFQNLHYLEKELSKLKQIEDEKRHQSQMAMKRIQKRLKQEELQILRGEDEESITLHEEHHLSSSTDSTSNDSSDAGSINLAEDEKTKSDEDESLFDKVEPQNDFKDAISLDDASSSEKSSSIISNLSDLEKDEKFSESEDSDFSSILSDNNF